MVIVPNNLEVATLLLFSYSYYSYNLRGMICESLGLSTAPAMIQVKD